MRGSIVSVVGEPSSSPNSSPVWSLEFSVGPNYRKWPLSAVAAATSPYETLRAKERRREGRDRVDVQRLQMCRIEGRISNCLLPRRHCSMRWMLFTSTLPALLL
ncbi:hypothetical protein KC19_3G084300 [Ceratodon purpureus]|uniref:Uncharacterized protein n=1 Tax=Ceratodon purpureus TaxID=3225 RepID=A0A8T0IIR6_CERPU|nr:hypothetical protein KC19_3G084300 [Ceratodon purpureus]